MRVVNYFAQFCNYIHDLFEIVCVRNVRNAVQSVKNRRNDSYTGKVAQGAPLIII